MITHKEMIVVKKWVINVLLVIFAAIFLVSGYFLLDYYLDSRKQQDSVDELVEILNSATQPKLDAPQETIPVTTPEGETLPSVSELVEVTNPDTGEIVELLPEFSELYLMNPNLVGWISIEDTTVNYPVLQTPDQPNYYLRRDFYGDHDTHGSIYIQENCDVFAPSDNLTIYGHRMKDGTMFNNLRFYEDKDYWETHKYIQFNTLQQRHTYEIFVVFMISASSSTPFQYHHFTDAVDEAHFDEFVNNCRNYALYDTGITPTYGDKLITLSTCEYTHTNGRLVVVARRID